MKQDENVKQKQGKSRESTLPHLCCYSGKITAIAAPYVAMAAKINSCPKFSFPKIMLPKPF